MPARMTRSGWPRIVAGLAALALLGHAAHAAWNVGGDGLDAFFHQWVYDAIIFASAALCLGRAAAERVDRGAWLCLGVGLLAYFAGEVYWSLWLSGDAEPPFPSPADPLYLVFYPASYVALVLLVRARMPGFRPSLWLDGVVGTLAVAAVGAAFVIPPVLETAGGDLAVVATTIAYPIGDIVLVAMAVGVLALTGWRSPALVLLAAGFAVGGVADSVYLVQAARETYVEGGLLDTLWPLGTLAIGIAAWTRPPAREEMRLDGWGMMVVPGAMAALVLGLLVYDSLAGLDPLARVLTYAALVAIFARSAMTFGENVSLLEGSRREALTDALTGLGNRRALMADLGAHAERVRAGGAGVLALFDLDGFKQYNDTFGHPAGDALLARLGARLAQAVEPHGAAYRMGGDEFCVLVRGADAEPALAAARAALSERGEGFAVTSSYGTVAMPDDTCAPAAALQLADQRMYQQKDRRRASARRQAGDVLLRILEERRPALGEHVRAMTRNAVAVGRAMGMDNESLDVLTRACELHDIGKLAIPDAILDKPGPLDPDEQAFLRRHPAIGHRILSAAPALRPVADVVRACHERQDGTGYPDGMPGERIPLGARIIAVCDAYDAMLSDRAWRRPLEPRAAVERLREEAGTRFDPAVVDAFADVLDRSPEPHAAGTGDR